MSSTLGDMTTALQTLLMDHFRATAPTVDGQPFLAFELGTPIPDETFHLPADNPAYSPAVALEYLSHQANVAPRVQEGVLFETSNHIDNLYEILLMGATPVDPSGMELLGMVKRSARASFDDTLGTVTSAAIERFRPTHADPINWYDQTASGNWTKLGLDQFDDPPPPPPAGGGGGGGGTPRSPFLLMWRPAPEQLQSVLAERVSAHGVEKFREQAVKVIQQTAGLETAQPAETAVAATRAVAASPHLTTRREFHMRAHGLRDSVSDHPGPHSAAATAALAESTEAIIADNTHSNAMLAAARFKPVRIVPKLGDLPTIVAPPAPVVTSDGFSISVEVCLVHLRRPWLADGLLNLKAWFVPSVAKGSFSDGSGPGNATPLAVLPIACVFIRNLAIKARWSDADKAHTETSSHLGAFALLGRKFDQNSATLTVEGMQAIAWICQPMPVLPPQDPV